MADVTYRFSSTYMEVYADTTYDDAQDFCNEHDTPHSEAAEFDSKYLEIDGEVCPFPVRSWKEAAELAGALDRCTSYEEAAYLAYCQNLGAVYQYSDFADAFQGEYQSAKAFAQEFCEERYEVGKIPDVLRYNIDWEGVAADFRHDYTFLENPAGGVFVFRYD